MRIGVISDTHIPFFTRSIPQPVLESFATCDVIVHAGDIIESSVIEKLKTMAETRAVHGNMDSEELKRLLPDRLVFEVGGKRIGVTHGKGSGKKVLDEVRNIFDKKVDIVIFGHSHMPFNENIGGTLFFNPGSATDTLFQGKRTYGIITIEGDIVRGEIIEIGQG